MGGNKKAVVNRSRRHHTSKMLTGGLGAWEGGERMDGERAGAEALSGMPGKHGESAGLPYKGL